MKSLEQIRRHLRRDVTVDDILAYKLRGDRRQKDAVAEVSGSHHQATHPCRTKYRLAVLRLLLLGGGLFHKSSLLLGAGLRAVF